MAEKMNAFRLTKAPQNGAVLQRINDRAAFEVCGEFFADPTDDTEQSMSFIADKVVVRMISENDGAAVTPYFPVKSEDGLHFSACVTDVPTGGPYTLDVSYLNRERCSQYPMRGERRRHIFVGDVYLVAGQSNAAGMGMGRVSEEVTEAVRVYRNLSYWDVASFPLTDYDYAKQSMMLSFGKRIWEKAHVPVGLIPIAMGGAPIERFLLDKKGDLYRKTLTALDKCGTDICAVLWYQGCNEGGERWTTEQYLEAFASFVNHLRSDLQNPTLPVFTFQLNRYIIPQDEPSLAESYSAIREAQRRAALQIANVFVLPTVDGASLSDFIHGSAATNRVLGERLAAQVLPTLYGRGRELLVPSVQSIKAISPRELLLTFDGIQSFLYDFHAGVRLPIRVEMKEKVISIASYSISANQLRVTLEEDVAEGATVSAQYGNDPKYWLCDYDSQIPLLSFTHVPVEF